MKGTQIPIPGAFIQTILVLLIFLPFNAYAEYYLVREHNGPPCPTCDNFACNDEEVIPSCHRCARSPVRCAESKRHACNVNRSHIGSCGESNQRHKCGSCEISISYLCPRGPISACPSCAYPSPNSHNPVDFSSQPVCGPFDCAGYINPDDDDWNYDPDLSTGDDNAIVYPDLDIDE